PWGAHIEGLGQGLRALLGLEDVLLLDRHPRQLQAPARQLVAPSHVLLLGLAQVPARRQPLLLARRTVLRHRSNPLSESAGSAYTVSTMANDTFKALAHPLRRDIVERLSGGVATVGEVTRDFGVSKPTISRHLKLLEEAGVVSRVIEGRNHRLALRPEALAEASDWIERQRRRVGGRFGV